MEPRSPPQVSRPSLLLGIFYVLMLLGSIAGFFAIRSIGESLWGVEQAVATSSDAGGADVAHRSETLLHVLLALVVVVVAGQAAARVFAWLQQPPVIGEVLAGILLGPSLLGWLAPEVYAFILPASAAPYLAVVAQLGIILYMFSVGLELDTAALRQKGHVAVAISHASIVAPFLLGSLLALVLFTELAPKGVAFTPFALFLGASMSVTAFPVLARILSDRKMTRTPLGVIALACAATDDITAWCLVALVVGAARAQLSDAMLVLLMAAGYIAFMFILARPLIARAAQAVDRRGLDRISVSIAFAALLLSAWATEAIGIHAIFGAFLLGAVIPHHSRLATELPKKFEDIASLVLLPAFFALTGMRTEIGLIQGLNDWLMCAGIIVVATLGKFGGSLAAARLTGLPWRESAALGILMNTRGLMELIVLNIGLDLGILSPRLFAMMVLMALVTTIATSPVLQWLGVGKEAGTRG